MHPPFTTASSTAQDRIHKSAFIHYHQTSSTYQAHKSRINAAFPSWLSPPYQDLPTLVPASQTYFFLMLSHAFIKQNPDLGTDVALHLLNFSWALLTLVFSCQRQSYDHHDKQGANSKPCLRNHCLPISPLTPQSQLYGIHNQHLLTAAKNQPIFGTGQDSTPSKQILPSPWCLSMCKHIACKPTP